MSTAPHRIDVHHHILPPDYLTALTSVGVTNVGRVSFPQWSVETTLSVMDRHGIATAITSISAPGVYFGDRAFARDLARRCNEISARLVSDHPQRFGAFAVVPLPDVDAALREIEYALDTLKLDGIVLLASVGDQYQGDPEFDAVYAELHRRKAAVFIHPNVPPGYTVPKLTLPAPLVDFIFDTTRAVTNLIFSGTLERYPDISFILSHAGGAVPYLAWRIALFDRILPGVAEKAPHGAMAYLKRLYYDTALSAAPSALRSLQELVDPSHILFGSDYPFAPEPITAASVKGLNEYDGFDAQARAQIERGNALRLFPRLSLTGR
ncbi:MAG: amidohydrolase family protein [Thermodesulfobacteriota bacterium]|jgi:predicted TIM-barrel fold metal-dependent hydrolase